MGKVTGPLFSLSASKVFGKVLEYRNSKGTNIVSKKHKPGDIGPANYSIYSLNARIYTTEAVSKWQSLAVEEKQQWSDYIL